MRGDMVVLATRSMGDFASRVAYQLLTFPDFHAKANTSEFVGRMKAVEFADGEMEVEVLTSLRGKDVFLFASAARNSAGLCVAENKLELYHSIDAIKRAAAARITLFEPYYSSSRSDRVTRKNSVGFWVHYKTVVSLGVNHIITFQLHSDKSKTAVDPTLCAIDDIPAIELIKEYMAAKFVCNPDVLREHVRHNWLFCSVDAGGENVARRYAQAFGTKLIIAHKQRDYDTANTVERINVLSDTPIEGKEVWIVDDMIDTGGSVYALVKELNKRGVTKINIAIIHPVFSHPAAVRLRELHELGLLQAIVCTDTVEVTDQLRRELPFLHVVSAARLSAEIIMRLHEEKSLSPFFQNFEAEQYFRSLKLFF